jgi:hypothetical protein
MPQFDIHYTVEEANAMLPELRSLLGEIRAARDQLATDWEGAVPILRMAATNGGGKPATLLVADLLRLNDLMRSLASRGVLIKDIDRGLVDFPHWRDGQEVVLCWELSEERVEFWHDLESGFGGRQPI